ncbi:MAG: hypothetical protein ACRCXB_19210 [Aeromonadaceae bacterium]
MKKFIKFILHLFGMRDPGSYLDWLARTYSAWPVYGDFVTIFIDSCGEWSISRPHEYPADKVASCHVHLDAWAYRRKELGLSDKWDAS